jgi:hypothetical protein
MATLVALNATKVALVALEVSGTVKVTTAGKSDKVVTWQAIWPFVGLRVIYPHSGF